MKLTKHSDFIYQYDDFISHEQCDELVRTVESSYYYKNNPQSKTQTRNNLSLNLSHIAAFWENNEEIIKANAMSHEIIMKAHHQYLNDNKLLTAYMPSYYHNLGGEYFYRYYDENDYYDWHFDASGITEHVHSYIVYLNDDFDGGDTLFLTQKKRVKPKKGSVLCFTCDFYSIHKGSKVTNGMKKIIWVCTKRIFEQSKANESVQI